jgi:hypothetical protein
MIKHSEFTWVEQPHARHSKMAPSRYWQKQYIEAERPRVQPQILKKKKKPSSSVSIPLSEPSSMYSPLLISYISAESFDISEDDAEHAPVII